MSNKLRSAWRVGVASRPSALGYAAWKFILASTARVMGKVLKNEEARQAVASETNGAVVSGQPNGDSSNRRVGPLALPPVRANRALFELLFEGATKFNSAIGGVAGIVAAILLVLMKPDSSIKVWQAAIAGLVLLWFLSACSSALLSAVKDARDMRQIADEERARFEQERSERIRDQEEHAKGRGGAIVKAAIKPFSPYQTAKCVFIVNWPGGPLPVQSRVTIAVAEETHERPLGGGIVRPMQQDGQSVVTLDELHPDTEAILGALLDKQTHEEKVKKVRIGPAYDLQNMTTVPGGSSASGGASAVQSGSAITPSGGGS